jgi:hypothetical protein
VPRFHLNLFNGEGASPDEEGQDFADLPAARAEAIRGIRSLLASELGEGRVDLGGRIEIADVDGHILQTVAFAEAIEIRN